MGHVNLPRIGIITGIAQEARVLDPLLRTIGGDERPLLRCADMRLDRAASLAADLVAEGVAGLVSFGVAGGLAENLVPGDLVLPEVVHATNGGSVKCDERWFEGAFVLLRPQNTGDLISSPVPVMTREDKRALQQSSGAVAVDMESFTIAEFARAAGVPFIALRVIIDTADQNIPEAALAGTPFQVAKKAVKRPGDIPGLLRLGRHMEVAKKTLSRVGRDGLPFFGL